jgi:hypothetical protein
VTDEIGTLIVKVVTATGRVVYRHMHSARMLGAKYDLMDTIRVEVPPEQVFVIYETRDDQQAFGPYDGAKGPLVIRGSGGDPDRFAPPYGG